MAHILHPPINYALNWHRNGVVREISTALSTHKHTYKHTVPSLVTPIVNEIGTERSSLVGVFLTGHQKNLVECIGAVRFVFVSLHFVLLQKCFHRCLKWCWSTVNSVNHKQCSYSNTLKTYIYHFYLAPHFYFHLHSVMIVYKI